MVDNGIRVLVACEFSGVVRDAFRKRGFDAVSCDLLPTEVMGPHYQGDLLHLIATGHLAWHEFDLMIAHPPCTYLCNSGVRWLYHKVDGKLTTNPARFHQMREAAKFFYTLLNAPIRYVAIENPIMHKYAQGIILRGQDQLIQPWQYGHGETKATCLWLKDLPRLKPTNVVAERNPRVHHASPGPNPWKERSRTLTGIADAMAQQWGDYLQAELTKSQKVAA